MNIVDPVNASQSSFAPSEQQSAGTSGKYAVSIDGLRFFAFFLVFLHHSFPDDKWADFGTFGVQIFFVISGFLIGGILLDLRQGQGTLGRKLLVFYGRRALRIFPVYYLTVLALMILPQNVGFHQYWAWDVAYLLNVKVYLMHHWAGSHSHFWSLAVEEHFYLLAPLVVLLLPSHLFRPVFIAVWLACVVERIIAVATGNVFLEYLSPSQFDCLTVGICAAGFVRSGRVFGVGEAVLKKLVACCSIAAAPLIILWRLSSGLLQLIGAVFGQWTFAVATASVIVALWSGNGQLDAFFRRKELTYLGKMSYGLYLFHLPCLLIWGNMYPGHEIAVSVLGFITTFLIAASSWRWFETPINRLKRFIPYT